MDNVAHRRTGDSRKIDSPVFLEVLIFNRSDRVEESLRALLVRHQDAPLQCKAPNKLAIVCVNFRDYVGAIRFKCMNLRKIARVHKKQSGSRAEKDRAKEKEGERDAVNQLPTAQAKSDRRETQHRKKSLAQKERLRERLRSLVSKELSYQELAEAVQGCGFRASRNTRIVIATASAAIAASRRTVNPVSGSGVAKHPQLIFMCNR